MGKKYCIVGFGKTGLSCLRYLTRKNAEVTITDSRDHPPGLAILRSEFAQVPTGLGHFNTDFLLAADEIILSPGISLAEPALQKVKEKGTPIIGDIELFTRENTRPIIAVTGSNGKSTVTTLVGEMAKACGIKVGVGGNIGVPVLDLLPDPAIELFVLELSSFQLETTYHLSTQSAVLLNLSPDHLDRYANMQSYLQAKRRIYMQCENPVINRDQLECYANLRLQKSVSFGLNPPQQGEFGLRDGYLAYGEENLLAAEQIKLKGRHQYANALAALALGYVSGFSLPKMLEAVKYFPGLPHRCQWVSRYQEMDWYNDSKATNIGAAAAAIFGLGEEINGKIILLAGGLGKNADFTELRGIVEKYCRTAILFGRDAKIIGQAWQDACTIRYVRDLAQAVRLASEDGQPGDAVLLAPACASFDMFRDFEHRGDAFTALVRGLR